jgi:hypothetical protein
LTVATGIPRAWAMRGAWASALSGLMSGSRPEAEVVTMSAGTVAMPALCAAAASVAMRSRKCFDPGERLLPLDAVAS